MELVPLTKQIPDTEPKIRVYEHYAVLNAAAVNLLGVQDGDYVQFAEPYYSFRRDDGKKFIYLRRTSAAVGSYVARKRKGTMRISSRKLATLLGERLDGKGSYRVCPEDTVADKDGTWYNIFFVNYDKKDSD